uniref:Putative secreted peptide n=1 Tax=Anopheles braziliensis TaxID=58242 RepID=A0A2M3ZWG4_9DIPT
MSPFSTFSRMAPSVSVLLLFRLRLLNPDHVRFRNSPPGPPAIPQECSYPLLVPCVRRRTPRRRAIRCSPDDPRDRSKKKLEESVGA